MAADAVPGSTGTPPERLRVLIANEHPQRLAELEAIVRQLGYGVVGQLIDPREVVRATHSEHVDIAVVGVAEDTDHALSLITSIVQAAACPVIAVLHAPDAGFVSRAARLGLFGYVTHDSTDELRAQMDIALCRYAEFHRLEGAFARRATIERAKGILMERHSIPEQDAFQLLRQHSQRTGRRLVEVAQAVTTSHLLLPVVAEAKATGDPPGDSDGSALTDC